MSIALMYLHAEAVTVFWLECEYIKLLRSKTYVRQSVNQKWPKRDAMRCLREEDSFDVKLLKSFW